MREPGPERNGRVLQISSGMTAEEHRATFSRIQREGVDGIAVTIFGSAFGPTWDAQKRYDLSFLEHYVGIRRLDLNVPQVHSIAPIEALAECLVELSVGEIRDASVSLRPVAACRKLSSLTIVRTKRDLGHIGELTDLRRLSLVGHGGALEWTHPLVALEHLDVGFATLSDSRFLERFPRLRRLGLRRLRGLGELVGVEGLLALESIELDGVSSLVRLPHLDRLKALALLVVVGAKGLVDLSTLRESVVEELALIQLPLKASDLSVLSEMPRLQRAVVWLASRRETAQVVEELGPRAVPTTNDLPRYVAHLLYPRTEEG